MARNHMRVLAEQIYNEQNTVTYRLLSRLLGVHVNIAKQMLTEFYQQAKTEGKGCHATYVLGGLLEETSGPGTSGSDVKMEGDYMMSSPPVPTQGSTRSNGSVGKRVRTIILADENDVYNAKRKFSELTSIHIYSLGPSVVPDAILLTTSAHEISKKYDNLSPLEAAETYGIILNTNAIKRQLTKYVPPAVVVGTAASKSTNKPIPKQITKEPPPPAAKPVAAEKNTSEPTKSTTTMKRTASGNIMSAFANAPPKRPTPAPKKEEEPETKTETASAVAEPAIRTEAATSKPVARVSAKRQQELDEINKMMEDDEPEELEDFPPDPAPVEESQSTAISVDSPATAVTEPPADGDEAPKRKRGKRKVLKKTTKRDEKGYLVTKNEYVYESFSEDEDSDVAPKVAKTAAGQVKAGNTAGGDKKGKGNAAGQKSLMSFFGKK